MKGYGIYVKNDLLEPKHISAMGTAIWEYLWCLDKITSIDEDGTGKVLGGKPIKRKEISDCLGISERHISIHLKILESSGYINLLRTPYGFVISVNKSAKIFNNKNKEKLQKVTPREVTKSVKRSYNSGNSLTKKVTSNKTIQLDNTKTIQVAKATTSFGNEDINLIMKKFYDYLEVKPLRVKQQRWATQRLLKRYGLERSLGLVEAQMWLVENDQYAYKVNSIEDLWNKQNDILMAIKKRKNNQLRRV